jgi:hypothetical protein
MIAFLIPSQVSIGSLFAVLMIVYAFCFYAASKLGTNLQTLFRKPWKGLHEITSNWLTAFPTISGMLFLLVTAIQFFQESVGIPTGSLVLDNPYDKLLALAYSPIVEEIGFRFTPIGTVVAISLARYLRLNFLSLAVLYPDKGKQWAGLPTIQEHGLKGVTIPEWTAIFGTAFIFGVIHYTAGGGWDIGKISGAAVAGIGLALIYLWKGLHASILLHWFFNYYGSIWSVAEMINETLFINLTALIFVLTLFLGTLGWVYLIWKTVIRIRDKVSQK